MSYLNDQRIILTLDAGVTNFVFTAIQAGKEISEPIHKTIEGLKLKQILSSIIEGFNQLYQLTKNKVVAISFCFPGPADYKNGIIGDLQNILEFGGGVALKSILENKLNIPFTDAYQEYEPVKKIGLGISKLGTSGAISIGAYTYALNQLNQI